VRLRAVGLFGVHFVAASRSLNAHTCAASRLGTRFARPYHPSRCVMYKHFI